MPGQAPPATDERQLLLAYIAQQRDGIRYAAHGLTDEQARLAPTASSLSVGGLVKHVAHTERGWIDTMLHRQREVSAEDEMPEKEVAAYEDSFRLGPDETLADALAFYEEVARETEAAVAGLDDLEQPVPVPKGVPWFPDDVEAWSARWVLLHVVEETARHARSRRHRQGVDRRRHHVRADGGGGGLARHRLAEAVGAARAGSAGRAGRTGARPAR